MAEDIIILDKDLADIRANRAEHGRGCGPEYLTPQLELHCDLNHSLLVRPKVRMDVPLHQRSPKFIT